MNSRLSPVLMEESHAPQKLSIAALVHNIRWEILEPEFELSPGIKLGRVPGSTIGDLYERACSQHGIDFGDPFLYDTYVLFDPDVLDIYGSYGEPWCVVDRVCNVIAAMLAEPIPMCRVFHSGDHFRTFWETREIYLYGFHTESLLRSEFQTLNDANKREMRLAWANADGSFRSNPRGRVSNALAYFYHAWRSGNLEQVCIHLGIFLELLFSPHSQAELSHQISLNTAKFLSNSPVEREAIYKRIKKFYRLRSAVVHGGMPGDDPMFDQVPGVFADCAEIVQRILQSMDQVSEFDVEERRQRLLASYMFEA